jgi:hypothetical protein
MLAAEGSHPITPDHYGILSKSANGKPSLFAVSTFQLSGGAKLFVGTRQRFHLPDGS